MSDRHTDGQIDTYHHHFGSALQHSYRKAPVAINVIDNMACQVYRVKKIIAHQKGQFRIIPCLHLIKNYKCFGILEHCNSAKDIKKLRLATRFIRTLYPNSLFCYDHWRVPAICWPRSHLHYIPKHPFSRNTRSPGPIFSAST